MKRLLAAIGILGVLVASGCGGSPTDPAEGCRGHGGVLPGSIGRDATNSHVPFACKDGTIGKLDL